MAEERAAREARLKREDARMKRLIERIKAGKRSPYDTGLMAEVLEIGPDWRRRRWS